MISENQMRIDYATRLSDPDSWLWMAQALFSTAELLEAQIYPLWVELDKKISVRNVAKEHHDPEFDKDYARVAFEISNAENVYLMLMGYCLENLLKAYIISKKREVTYEEVFKEGKLPKEVRSHNLETLIKKCQLQVNEELNPILRRLSRHTVWIGRYPMAASMKQNYIFANVPSGFVASGSSKENIHKTKELIEFVSSSLGFKLR